MNKETERKEHEAVRLETRNGYLTRRARQSALLETVNTLIEIMSYGWF